MSNCSGPFAAVKGKRLGNRPHDAARDCRHQFKKRFAFSDEGLRIRASRGHSVTVDLGYEEAVPTTVLYRGTAAKNLPSIQEKGLLKGQRHQVHLSADQATAHQVEQRHGRPVFRVLAGQMHRDGFVFYRSAHGVWLTDRVPVNYLQLELKLR
jgi:putative RNA 2'-phosphotransferase